MGRSLKDCAEEEGSLGGRSRKAAARRVLLSREVATKSSGREHPMKEAVEGWIYSRKNPRHDCIFVWIFPLPSNLYVWQDQWQDLLGKELRKC